MVIFPINLGGRLVNMKAYIIPASIPFLIGGSMLKNLGGIIDLKNEKLIIAGGREIGLQLLGSGHLAMDWNVERHKDSKPSQILLTEKGT